MMGTFTLAPRSIFSPSLESIPMNQTFNVQGMNCGHCERAVTEAVRALDPSAQVRIDLPKGTVEVASNLPRERIVQAIAQEGYRVQ
jgi:copper chaperone